MDNDPVSKLNHLVIIPTRNRHKKLFRCIDSILDNIAKFDYHGTVEILLIDDSAEEQARKNLDRLRDIAIKVHHFGPEKQQTLMVNLNTRLASKGIHIRDYIFSDSGKKGYGGVRNLGSVVAIGYTGKNTIVTFLDDDVSLENMIVEKGKIKKEHIKSFFHELDKRFSDPSIHILGGGYTLDRPPFPRRFTLGLKILRDFLQVASTKSPNDLATEFVQRTWVEIQELNRVSNTDDTIDETWMQEKIPQKDITFADELHFLAAATKQLKRGRFRFALETPPQRSYPSKYLVAGNLSMRRTALERIPFPAIEGIRAEGVMWVSAYVAVYSHQRAYSINNPVGHYKATSGRDPLRDIPLSLMSQPLVWALEYCEKQIKDERQDKRHKKFISCLTKINDDLLSKACRIATEWHTSYLSTWTRYIHDLKKSDLTGWLSAPEYSEDLKTIFHLVRDLELKLPKIKRSLENNASPPFLKRNLALYGAQMRSWKDVVVVLRRDDCRKYLADKLLHV